MGEAIDHAKKEFLGAMYRSVERMTEHMIRNNGAGVLSEQALQENLRKNFEDLQDREE
jgi:hypothetical protein